MAVVTGLGPAPADLSVLYQTPVYSESVVSVLINAALVCSD